MVDLIVLGTGTRVEQLDPDILKALKRKGLNLEIQDTVEYTDNNLWHIILACELSFTQPNACATFNFLLSEGRPVGAALVPPHHIPP